MWKNTTRKQNRNECPSNLRNPESTKTQKRSRNASYLWKEKRQSRTVRCHRKVKPKRSHPVSTSITTTITGITRRNGGTVTGVNKNWRTDMSTMNWKAVRPDPITGQIKDNLLWRAWH